MKNSIDTQKRLTILSEWKSRNQGSNFKLSSADTCSLDEILVAFTNPDEEDEVIPQTREELATLIRERQRMEAHQQGLRKRLTEYDSQLTDLHEVCVYKV